MAFVVPTKRGRFEIRESATTPKGPRSRTLATFHELDDATIEKARERAKKPLDATDLRRSARKVGASIRQPTADRAARELIGELGKGRTTDPALRHILLDLLQRGNGDGHEPSRRNETAHDVAEWMASTPLERGKALVDLLLLADALPHGARRGKPLHFPKLDSTRE
jgi:hypothetical protein